MNKTKIKIFLKITKIINKKFCKDKLEINKIVFFNGKHKGKKNDGYYAVNSKIIGISKKEPLFCQIRTLLHELTHAYQNQIMNCKGKHNKQGERVFYKFMKEIDKTLKISV
ncbi:MAG: hypothetical protein IB618_03955 [Candidatus Pacearchaeota archaeon]|nr:MAG: hypothetical protein IB618_03955 [Candidatus Pacearchaeota archaeon]